MAGAVDVRASIGIYTYVSLIIRFEAMREGHKMAQCNANTHKCQSSSHGPVKVTLDRLLRHIKSILNPLRTSILIPLNPGESHDRLQRRDPSTNVDRVEAAPLAVDRLPEPHHVRDDAQVCRDADALAVVVVFVATIALCRQRVDLVRPPRDDADPCAAAGVLSGDGVADAA